ncbi:MAG: PHP domain-containing protein [DPANN group archaeon]|nr:PHP domain-containing protein [DPANN group archaeon]
MKLVDYHIHCNYSWDNKNKVSDIIEHISKAKNFKDTCIVAHFEPSTIGVMDPPNSIENNQIDTFLREVEKYNLEFGQNVKAGLEVEYEESYEKVLEVLLEEYPLDFVLGSCHWLCRNQYLISGTAESAKKLFDKYSPEEVAKIYFDKLGKAIESELFDSMAHPDIIKRNSKNCCGYFPQDSYAKYMPRIAALLKKNKTCFEINTNAAQPENFYPSPSAHAGQDRGRHPGRTLYLEGNRICKCLHI